MRQVLQEREGWEAGRSMLGLSSTWDQLEELVVADSAPRPLPASLVEAVGEPFTHVVQ